MEHEKVIQVVSPTINEEKYFLEEVNGEYPYNDNKITFLTNISDTEYYIYEESGITYLNPFEEPEVNPDLNKAILNMSFNVPGVTINITINNRQTQKIVLSQTSSAFSGNYKLNDIISYTISKTNYFSFSDEDTLSSAITNLEISLDEINPSNGDIITGTIKFTSNYIGTRVTVSYTNINDETVSLPEKTIQFLNSSISFTVENCTNFTYNAIGNNETLSSPDGGIAFSSGEKTIKLTFQNGTGNGDTGGTSGGEEKPNPGNGGGNVDVTGINIIPTSLTLHVGDTYQLQEQVLPVNATNKSVYWTLIDANGEEEYFEEAEFEQLPNQTLTFAWGTLTGPFECKQKDSNTARVYLYGRYLEELTVIMKINSTYSSSYYIERGIMNQGSTFTNTDEGTNTQKTLKFKLIIAATGGTRMYYFVTENGKKHDSSGIVHIGTSSCYINTIGDVHFECTAVWENEYHLNLVSPGASNTTLIINNTEAQSISKTITYEETIININIDTNLPGSIWIKKYSGDGTAYFVLDGNPRNGFEITSDIEISYGIENFGIRIPRNDTSNEKNIILRVHKKFLSINYEFGIQIIQGGII